MEDEPLAGVGGRLELELLPPPFNGRRLVQGGAPLAGATVAAVPAFGTRPTVPAVGAPARLVSSGARVRLLVDAAEPLVRHVGVGLGRGQGDVPQQLLHGP